MDISKNQYRSNRGLGKYRKPTFKFVSPVRSSQKFILKKQNKIHMYCSKKDIIKVPMDIYWYFNYVNRGASKKSVKEK